MRRVQHGGVTALVLAGGRATRMGGIDKGLQAFNGVPLALHALNRLRQAKNPLIAACAINVNRHLDTYAQWGYPVWPDTLEGQPGPLAGWITGLRRCTTRHLLTLPCDAPSFPLDLIERLAQGFAEADTDIAVACAPDEQGMLRRQPVFALVSTSLASDLDDFLRRGGRKVGQWLDRHCTVAVPFDQPGDDPFAFENINTLEHLRALEQRQDSPAP